MDRAERGERLSDATTRTQATVAPAARNLAPTPKVVNTAISPPERAAALWCRRSRSGSSFAVRMKRPATSEGAGEHGVQVSRSARLRSTFFWTARWCSQAAPRRHAGARASTGAARAVRRRSVRTLSGRAPARNTSSVALRRENAHDASANAMDSLATVTRPCASKMPKPSEV